MTQPQTDHITLEEPLQLAGAGRGVTFGFPDGMNCGERRFPLTPEGASRLVEQGHRLKMQRGAGAPIHYSDPAYLRAGADVCSRAEVLRADIVVSPAPLAAAEIPQMRRGALLVTLLRSVVDNPAAAKALQRAGVNVLAADLILADGHRLIADILHEIDGCASLSTASSLLADPIHGKGILLGGVTGIVPCEVTVLGSGMGAMAAAYSALGLGATVRMFDNNLYSLRSAARVLDQRVITSALHPKTLRHALQAADVVVVTPTDAPVCIDADTTSLMKERVLVFDLTCAPGSTFPAIERIDLASAAITTLVASPSRACYFNVGCRVPRTAAMALTNALVANAGALARAASTSLADIPTSMRPALLFYWGKCVNRAAADAAGSRAIDINLLLGN